MKTVLVDIYTRYSTRLLNEDRTEKRPWEGADRMTELQFESLLVCAEGEHIEKRVARSSLYPPDILGEEGDDKTMEPPRRPPMLQKSEEAVKMTGDVGRRPLVFVPDVRYGEALHQSENTERQPSPILPDFSFLRPPKNETSGRSTPISALDPIDKQAKQALRKPALNLPVSSILEEIEHVSAPVQGRPSLVPSLLTMGAGSGQVERAERVVLDEKVGSLQKEGQPEGRQWKPMKGPVARLKRPQLPHRTSAPDRVAGVLELVGQDTL